MTDGPRSVGHAFQIKGLLLGVVLPCLCVPVVLVLAGQVISKEGMTAAEKSWLPLVLVITAGVYSLFVVPILALVNLRLAFDPALTPRGLLVRGAMPLIIVFAAACIALRTFPNPTISVADAVWSRFLGDSDPGLLQPGQVWILVARDTLPAGTRLRNDHLMDMVTNAADVGDAVLMNEDGDLIGRRLERRVEKGEPITWRSIGIATGGAGMSRGSSAGAP